MTAAVDYRDSLRNLVNVCVENGKKLAQANAASGYASSLYLYFKQSTKHGNGELVLVPDGQQCPIGFSLAVVDGLRCDVPYDNYYEWVRNRSTRLPILAWAK